MKKEFPIRLENARIVVETVESDGRDWNADGNYKYARMANIPGVYCFWDRESIYVGESHEPYVRLKTHRQKNNFRPNDQLLIVRSPEFNKSVIFDMESRLLQYLWAENAFERRFRNSRTQQSDRRYFLKEFYEPAIHYAWSELLARGIGQNDAKTIEASERFKLSPLKPLNGEQYEIAREIVDEEKWKAGILKINGFPGTGKSLLAANIFDRLVDEGNYKVCLTAATTSVRKSLESVFQEKLKVVNKTGSKILPVETLVISGERFDVVIVDEAHSLTKDVKKRPLQNLSFKSILKTRKGHLQQMAEMLGGKGLVLLYDETQMAHPAAIGNAADLEGFKVINRELIMQERLEEGDVYAYNLFAFFKGEAKASTAPSGYDFRIYTSFKKMYLDLKELAANNARVRLLSGYSRKWDSQKNSQKPEFEIEGIELNWNTKQSKSKTPWVETEPAKLLQEVGYYETIQGFDLSYAGVIMGKDMIEKDGQIGVDENFVKGLNQKPRKNLPKTEFESQLKQFVLNRYRILLTRGAKGTFVFIEDEALKNRFVRFFGAECLH